MVKKKLIDVLTVTTEDKLDSNGAMRNVAVSDAWKRLRQNIDVQAWKGADSILQELSDSLQKINMLKSMTAQLAKLKSAFQNPDQMVEEDDYKVTPRENKSQILQLTGDLKKAKDEVNGLSTCLQDVRKRLEKENTVPDKIDTPNDLSEDARQCYGAVAVLCDKYKRGQRDADHLKKRLENWETRNKDLEKQIDERDDKINKLTVSVETLEKKHSGLKEEKMNSFKEQMKLKSLERQVELKESELSKMKQEHQELKDRLNAITESKSSEMADLFNPFPPNKVAEMFSEIFKKEWKDMFGYFKAAGKAEQDAAKTLLQLLQDGFEFCQELSQVQMERLKSDFLCLGDESAQSSTKLEEADEKQLCQLRKQTCKSSVEYTKNLFISKLEESDGQKYTLQEITDGMSYIEKCVELCWYMSLQTPPMFIDTDLANPKTLDKALYEVYTGKGTAVDFLLWPVLYKVKGGPVLKKGFVQAK